MYQYLSHQKTESKYCSPVCAEIAQKKYYENAKKATNFSIYERDGFRCQYCGKSPQDHTELEIDHIYPAMKGGSNDQHNLITSCKKCNSEKSDKVLDIQYLMKLWDTASKVELDFKEAKQLWDKKVIRRMNRGQ